MEDVTYVEATQTQTEAREAHEREETAYVVGVYRIEHSGDPYVAPVSQALTGLAVTRAAHGGPVGSQERTSQILGPSHFLHGRTDDILVGHDAER
jgi:hypothetical protein